jgi:ligand-binding SRPBCC domain-containing protein
MQVGTLLDYRLKLHGFPVRWQSKVTVWEPPERFVDEQTHGPYHLWRHEHRFVSRNTGTDVIDHVDYAVPCGALVNSLFVAPDLRRVFAFRRQKMPETFGG